MKYIFKTMILLGGVIVLGTAGASDLNTIGNTAIVIQLLTGIGLVVIGFRVLEVLYREDRG